MRFYVFLIMDDYIFPTSIKAGTDTTIITLHWTLAIMAEYPDIQRKVAMEIEKVTGHERLPSLEDRGRLPYTEATMMEVLRFSSILPLGVPHSTTCDVNSGRV